MFLWIRRSERELAMLKFDLGIVQKLRITKYVYKPLPPLLNTHNPRTNQHRQRPSTFPSTIRNRGV